MVGRLQHLSKRDAERRADELLERFELTDAASRLVKTFSGGMRRRLDLAASLVAAPAMLFSVSRPPGSTRAVAVTCGRCCGARPQRTIVLTTQAPRRADQLADEIIVLDHGRTVAAAPTS
jgi:ABC-type multidrug transport system ATPase subunit